MRQRCVADGKQVNIPVLGDWSEGGTEKVRLSGRWLSRFKRVGRMSRQIRTFIILRRDDEVTEMLLKQLILSFQEKPLSDEDH